MVCGMWKENKTRRKRRRKRMIEFMLGKKGDVGGAAEEERWEKGGWAEKCPTEGGTDEVRESGRGNLFFI